MVLGSGKEDETGRCQWKRKGGRAIFENLPGICGTDSHPQDLSKQRVPLGIGQTKPLVGGGRAQASQMEIEPLLTVQCRHCAFSGGCGGLLRLGNDSNNQRENTKGDGRTWGRKMKRQCWNPANQGWRELTKEDEQRKYKGAWIYGGIAPFR
ncbi:hypothetical protein K438DRAFT_1772385 [Mycena galopus ATCC 62051]|nr:hypothetical protein K438DRAFT_1772385 [Mycena galopus ATCC 62051]